MKKRVSKPFRFVLPAVLATLCAWAPRAQADWGSLRANNREERRHEPERGHREAQRRHVDIEAERRHAFFWAQYRPGMEVSVLPAAYAQVSVGATGYYYYQGVYYQPVGSGFAVVAPPAGVIVPQLPDGAEAMVLGDTSYYYAGGAFYVQQPNGFMVVAPPSGAMVTGLPPGAAPVPINGVVYYLAGTTYFRPVMHAGVTVYVTARP